MPRLTAKLLAALKPGDLVRDDAVRGLFASVGPTGAISLKLQVDVPGAPRSDGKRPRSTLRKTLGRYPELTLDAARLEATRLIAEVRAGHDPRAGAAPRAAEWTVERAFGAYVEDLAKRPGSELTQRDMRNRLARYLDDWRMLPLASLTREMVEARQAKIARDIREGARQRNATGARTANAFVRDVSAVWNYATGFTPLPALPPTHRVKMIGEVRGHHEIPIAALGEWWTAVGDLKNPMRRAMHRLGLLSGLRPGNLTGIRREWVRGDRIEFPAEAMKGRRPFTLPLSEVMIAEVTFAWGTGAALYGKDCPWLFPTRDADGQVVATRVTREARCAALRNRTGHALRHTWKTCARNARISEASIEILLAHSLGGMRDIYGSLADQFDRLRDDQELVTAWILARAGVLER